ncbi:uncharacterized protein MYCFIDRAFT_173890 [Pseudocercospora fijiensis CIRAD86]|uniref:Uncharacterized protein n=1 Tax=Pseudocercospora fijiensis (strain CIRAD86) TaxID=383855 RepID=M3B6P2_PSEFD|nr:uncharacterized protein MYCFIDRAFT_173890 [Pseudocercospora fijiensis CIRAD86]EME85017.1 hypothetical protein MYCFIDRAFT_173890 [Pseudocercospora fijiensis CIRAD86]
MSQRSGRSRRPLKYPNNVVLKPFSASAWSNAKGSLRRPRASAYKRVDMQVPGPSSGVTSEHFQNNHGNEDSKSQMCSVCVQRSGWEFVKDFFLREQSLLKQNEALKTQHENELQDLYSALGAMRLSYYSAQAHVAALQSRQKELETSNSSIHKQQITLESELQHLRRLQSDLETHALEAKETHNLNCEMIKHQNEELERRSSELHAAEAAARQLGDMMNEVVSANDFAAASFKGAVNVADLVMRNKYLESEILDLRNALGRLREDVPSPSGGESISDSGSFHSFVPLPEEAMICNPVEVSSAYDHWEERRIYHKSKHLQPKEFRLTRISLAISQCYNQHSALAWIMAARLRTTGYQLPAGKDDLTFRIILSEALPKGFQSGRYDTQCSARQYRPSKVIFGPTLLIRAYSHHSLPWFARSSSYVDLSSCKPLDCWFCWGSLLTLIR